MLKDLLDEELLDKVEHACLQIIHMNKGKRWKYLSRLRMPQAQAFDFQALLKKTSEG